MPTPNMDLDLPVVSSTLGPEWASLLNALIEIIDAHDHSPDKGTKVTPAGILINALLDINNQNVANANSYGFKNLSAADLTVSTVLQKINNDLWWVPSSGAQVQITDGDSLVTGAVTVYEPASYPFTLSSSVKSRMILVDTDGGSRTITLPAAADGQSLFYIKDRDNNAQTNPFTLSRTDAGDTIDDDAADVVFDSNNVSVGVLSDGVSRWYLF